MENKYLEKLFYIFFSIIPLSIVLGPSISLINIVIINFLFLYYLYISKDFIFLKNKIIILLLFLYVYLIFNSFISIDPLVGIKRNLGFFRFILLFLAFNYFFYYSNNPKKIFKWWFFFLFIFTLDVYVEFLTGSNILGFGDIEGEYGPRVVSFFKDEPIAGAFILGFFIIIIGNLFDNFNRKNNYLKCSIYFFSFLILLSILLTGERANSIKAISIFLIFFSLNHFIKIKTKILLFSVFCIIMLFSLSYSSYIKYRFNDSFLKLLTSKENIINTYQNSVYSVMYKTGYHVFLKYPIFGVGNKNFRVEVCQNDMSPFFGKEFSPYQLCTTHPHQIYFEFLAEHGIVGSLLLLSILFFLIFRLLRVIFVSKNYLQFGCFLYLILVFSPLLPGGSFFNDFSSTIFWINLSLLYAANKETNIFN